MSVFTVILLIIAAEVLALALLFVVLVRTHVRRYGAGVRRMKQSWAHRLPAALQGDPEAVEHVRRSLRSRRGLELFRQFLEEQLRDLPEEDRLRFRRLSRSVGLTSYLEHELNGSRDELKRAAAARSLVNLREKVSLEAVLALLDSDDEAVVLVAGYAVASLRDPTCFLRVFRAIYGRTRITLHGATELLSRFGERSCPVILALLDGVVERYAKGPTAAALDPAKEVGCDEQAVQVVMADLLGHFAHRPAVGSLVRLLEVSEHEEVLIHLVKALAKIGDAAAVDHLAKMLGHENWVLRSQAAQGLGLLGAVDEIPRLRGLLADDDVRVRAYAQAALRTLEEVGSRQQREAVYA